jgi:hypothetical protein
MNERRRAFPEYDGFLGKGGSMTHTTLASPESEPHTATESCVPATRSRWARFFAQVQFVSCLLITGGVLAYLLWPEENRATSVADRASTTPAEMVRVVGVNQIRVKADCPLCQMLQVAAVKPTEITTPVLTVTGTVVASLRPAGTKDSSDSWQFNSPELLTAYTDWQKATADIAFAQTQLAQIRQLADTRVAAQQKLAERMKRLVEAGTDAEKDLVAVQAELIQSQIQGRKEVHEAETAVRLAQRAEAALARQIQQAGLEPDLLRSAAADVDIVMADVPEGMVSRVKLAQGCEARFFSLPGQLFPGHVRAIAPVLSKEHRSLRVLFAIRDPQDLLRPGMFADIGLGTDARSALLMPPEGIVHVGRSDYALVRTGDGDWHITEVQVGELHDAAFEILTGLRAGDHVAGRGAILLKPVIVQALQARIPPRSTHPSQKVTRS